jgi:hypothetical protein
MFHCNLCSYQTKRNGDLKKHKQNIHNIDVHVYYMFYDQDNEHIVKNLPCTMIY